MPRHKSISDEAGIAVFRVAFERWVTETAPQELPQLLALQFNGRGDERALGQRSTLAVAGALQHPGVLEDGGVEVRHLLGVVDAPQTRTNCLDRWSPF
jgi:hypothetical protein